MSYEFSLAHLTVLQCSPPEMVEIASQAGYTYVSFRLTAVTSDEKTSSLIQNRVLMKETKSRLADTGIQVYDIELAKLDPETEPETYLRFLEAGAELGARSVITQLPDPNRQRATERFARLSDLAKPFGLTVDLEFPWWTETPDLHAAVTVLEAVNKPNAGILIDTLHFERSHSSLEELKTLPREWFHFVHLCDAPKAHEKTQEEKTHTARAGRLFPGEGDIDLKEILNSIPNVPYSLEIPNEDLLKKLGPQEFASRALQAAKQYLKKLALGSE